jgi:hypothetical protein
MKHLILVVSVIFTLSSGASTTGAGWGYGYGGRVWPGGGWGRAGYPPAYGNRFGVPVVASYPVYGYYYNYPAYGYAYAPPAYPYVQPAYAYQPAQPYGLVPTPGAVAPTARPALTAPLYDYSRAGRQLYRPVASARTVAGATPPAPADTSALAERERRTNDELTRVRGERDQARTELSIWSALGVTPEQIRGFQQQLAKLQAQNKFLVRQNSELEFKLSRYEGPEKEVKMPTILTGKVLAVDSKYEFVVLNIGGNQGVAKNGKLLVHRDGKLVAKLRVTTVESNSSIANIMPDWKVATVREGDQVIH